jgi:hypothetical protein
MDVEILINEKREIWYLIPDLTRLQEKTKIKRRKKKLKPFQHVEREDCMCGPFVNWQDPETGHCVIVHRMES